MTWPEALQVLIQIIARYYLAAASLQHKPVKLDFHFESLEGKLDLKNWI
jgi:hypothetical protein